MPPGASAAATLLEAGGIPMHTRINAADNVAIALQPLAAGTQLIVDEVQVILKEDIPQGHKFALRQLVVGEQVIKYGASIGRVTEVIAAGAWVHTHNVKTNLEGELQYQYDPISMPVPAEPVPQTFQGFRRRDGGVGVRNEIWILPTVSCTNQTATLIARAAVAKLAAAGQEGLVDGIYEFKHPYGCSQLGEDLLTTQKMLAAMAKHPNAGGVLVLGLGCENNRIQELQKVMGEYDEQRVQFLVAQDVEDEVAVGSDMVVALARQAGNAVREEVPLAQLKLGLKCGGSDGLSGITANPLVGRVSDLLVAQGGTSVLTEVPEMFGAEQILMNRAQDEVVFGKIVELINGFKKYFLDHNQPVYENPSPGNKDGGITTLEDKSLGCTEKGGYSPVVDVTDYGEIVQTPGLNLLCSPGNDLVATTALAAAGCQVVLFTTGRGTPFGTCVPTLKIATNSKLYNFKGNWMDFNAGSLVEGDDFAEAAQRLLDQVIAVASGDRLAKNEEMEFRDIAIWKRGVTV